MNGRITVDGIWTGEKNDGYELTHHGGEANQNSLVSVTYSIDRTLDALELMERIKESIKEMHDSEQEAIRRQNYKAKINKKLRDAGKAELSDDQLEVIADCNVLL